MPPIGDLGTDEWKYLLPGRDSDSYSAYRGAFVVLSGERAEDISAERFAEVEAVHGESTEGGCSVDIVLLVRLTDGSYATCMAWADYTGWGCQDDAVWKVALTRDDAIRFGLDQRGRRLLGLSLDG